MIIHKRLALLNHLHSCLSSLQHGCTRLCVMHTCKVVKRMSMIDVSKMRFGVLRICIYSMDNIIKRVQVLVIFEAWNISARYQVHSFV